MFGQISGAKKPRFVNKNLPNFDYRQYHFGFILSTNQSNFVIDYKPDFANNDSLIYIENNSVPGFNLGIVATYKLIPNIRVRFVPTLSFQDRKLNYHFLQPDSTVKQIEKVIESTYVEFPAYLKLRTNRIGNMAAYVLGGAKLMIDMSSKKDVESKNERDLIPKVKRYQTGAELGGGFDFFLPYFKFGIEMKMQFGLGNALIEETHKFSAPFQGLRPRSYAFTLTFEG